MKFRSLLTGFLACAFFALPVQAAGPVAVLNTQEIMDKSTAAISIKEQITSKQKTFQEEMTKKEAQFNAEEQELRKQHSVLSPEVFEKKIKAFKAKETVVQKEVQAKRAEIDNAISGSLAQIQKAVSEIVGTMAKEKGYVVVLRTELLLWNDPTLDITQDVLAKLNVALPKVTVTFKAVPAADAKE